MIHPPLERMPDSRYLTEIPTHVNAVDVRFHAGGRVAVRHYKISPALVGQRYYNEHGILEWERSLFLGLPHGVEFRFDDAGNLESRTGYRKGMEHGLALQWSPDGLLVGQYSMDGGSGWDLWWESTVGKGAMLAEARRYQNGRRCGDEWWFASGECLEAALCFRDDLRHEVEWRWGRSGKVQRGFPRFLLQDQRVTKRAYLLAATQEPGLRVPEARDAQPWRTFPDVVCAAIQRHR